MDDFVWKPTEAIRSSANLTDFMRAVGVADYQTLVHRADTEPEWFHSHLIQYLGLRFEHPYTQIIDESAGLAHVKWCVGGTTNVVTHCLDRWRATDTERKEALVWEGEDGTVQRYQYHELDRDVSCLAGGLQQLGVGSGDVVGIYLPNLPEAVVALLAVARIGAVALPLFSGFGVDALVSRLEAGSACAIITVDGSMRRGKPVSAKSVVDEALCALPQIKHVIVVRNLSSQVQWQVGRDVWWHELITDAKPVTASVALDSEAPLLLIYTSGTSGKPKGVVHSHCGFALKVGLDLGICMDFKASDRILWMADMGWLVGPILVFGALFLGGTIVLAEGAPDYPQPDRMWRLIDDHAVSYLGIAPTLVRALMQLDEGLLARHDLSSLRVFTSTGEPWTRDAWLWLFKRVGRGRIPLLNYSGGTEVGGIVVATVIHPLKPCAFSGPVPGTGADIVDQCGNTLAPNEVGELVMRRPSVGLTRGLWKDEARYLDTYWNVIPEMWVHGDLASIDEDGVWYVHGRSDDTLKVAGKRTGPAEIESLLLATGLVSEAAAVATPDHAKGSAILCFCVLAPRVAAAEQIEHALVDAVVTGLGAPFRPKQIIFVPALPKTRNMKIMRRLLRGVWHDESLGDLSSLVNPESLDAIKARRKG